MRHLMVITLAAVAITTVGCAAKSKTVPETTLSGTAALSSSPVVPTTVTATDEAGRAIVAPIGGDGRFVLKLSRGHSYKLTFAMNHDLKVVFPRTSGRLDTTFNLRTDGAKIQLGSIRYVASAPTGGFHIVAATPGAQQTGDVNDGQSVSCEDGSQGSGGEGGSETEATDGSDAADANTEMAVGDHNAPDQVDGCGGGTDGDNVEQEGEH